ncbi:MAG: hypothetical protein Kow00117_16190 [Phototrophicales bacterium]
MTIEEQFIITLYVFIAALLGMVIGLERERRNKSAGVRTHMLVCVGACLFTGMSRFGFDAGDPTRVASNVVTGIGFLGAGVIYKSRGEMHDLTTAASIWATAAIGMAVGGGAWFVAITVTVTNWLILSVLRNLPIRRDAKINGNKRNGKKKSDVVEELVDEHS